VSVTNTHGRQRHEKRQEGQRERKGR